MKNSNGLIDILYLGTKNALNEEEERVGGVGNQERE